MPVLRMILVIGVSGRDRLAVCRTTGCREQPISDQGGLERVLQTASRSLPLARRFSQIGFTPEGRAHWEDWREDWMSRLNNAAGIHAQPADFLSMSVSATPRARAGALLFLPAARLMKASFAVQLRETSPSPSRRKGARASGVNKPRMP